MYNPEKRKKKILSSILPSDSIPSKFLLFALPCTFTHRRTVTYTHVPLLLLAWKESYFKQLLKSPDIAQHPKKRKDVESPVILPFGNTFILLHRVSVAFGFAFPSYNAGNLQNPKTKVERLHFSRKGFSRFGSQPVSTWTFGASLIPWNPMALQSCSMLSISNRRVSCCIYPK